MANPFLTSDDLIASVKRKILFPTSQSTFTDEEILAFANEEMAVAQVPSILQYHEEYFVTTLQVPLEDNKSRYPIPERAIGMKLRDLFWADSQDNLFEMTRVDSDDRAFFQRNIGANESVHKFYLEGNDVVLTPQLEGAATGSLVFVYYLRPNQLVKNERAAVIEFFVKDITFNNSSIIANDTITIGDVTFTAVSGSPGANEFQIGASSVETATNFVAAINTDGTYSAINGTPSTNIVTVQYDDLTTSITTSNSSGFAIETTQTIQFESIPDNITNSSVIDFLQTKSGHKTKAFGIQLGKNVVSSPYITFNNSDIPSDLVIGDYIASENECIIPQIPSDLHNNLAERTSARILAALGDQAGLQAANTKIQENEFKQASLIDNRTEGAPKKITARHALLRYQKIGVRRRF